MTPTLEQLRDESKEKEFISYQELLGTVEWQEKRSEIIKRDNYVCSNCGASETITHFDEKLRQKFNLRFEFEDEKSVVPAYVTADEKHYHLEVHHKFYVLDRLPWLYDSADLETLCNWCHWDFHQNNNVSIYSETDMKILHWGTCRRCNGAGHFPEFSHVQGGVCFRCNGARYEYPLVKLAVNNK